MINKLLVFLLLTLPTSLLAQSSFSDPEQACTGPVFTVVEQLPALKISRGAFEDSLTTALRTKQFPLKDGEITYRFIVTRQSTILDLNIDSGGLSKQRILKETILQFADQWAPARQNGHIVCAHVRLKITVSNERLAIAIFQ